MNPMLEQAVTYDGCDNLNTALVSNFHRGLPVRLGRWRLR